MKFTFTYMTMACAMGLLSSAFLKTAMSAKLKRLKLRRLNMTVPVLNATMYPANVSLGVSVSTIVGAPARAESLSPFSLISCCAFCVQMCAMCVCVYEREREREHEGVSF